MAINLELEQAAGIGRLPGIPVPVLQRPLVAFTNIVAAGTTALNDGAKAFSLRARNNSDSVYVLIQLASESTQASAANARKLNAGEVLEWVLPPKTLGSAYEIDIRAA